jgi:hypothetical protein
MHGPGARRPPKRRWLQAGNSSGRRPQRQSHLITAHIPGSAVDALAEQVRLAAIGNCLQQLPGDG